MRKMLMQLLESTMIKQILIALMIFSVTSLSYANKNTPKTERTEVAKAIAKGSELARAIEALNKTLDSMGMPKLEIMSLEMGITAQGRLATAIRNFEAEVSKAENRARLEAVRNQGLIQVGAELILMDAVFKQAGKELKNEDIGLLAENVVNWLKSAVEKPKAGEKPVSVELIKEAISQTLAFGRGEITEASLKEYIKRMDDLGLRPEELVRCK